MNFKVEGYQQAAKILGQLNEQMQKSIMRSALRRASKPILVASQANVPIRSGKLRKKLRIVGMRQMKLRKSEVSVAVKPVFGINKQKLTENSFYGVMVHDGTKERKSRKKNGVLRFETSAGKIVYTRKAKAMQPNPYLAKGFEQGNQATVDNFGKELATAVEKYVIKNFKPATTTR